MSIINIAGLTPVDDPSYRYKMPRIIAKVEGRGNGIKTVIVNIVDLSLALNREAPEITKFFGCELGSQTTYSPESDRAIVNGAHTAQDLQNHLSKYIEGFVLCKQCKLPEAHYKVKAGIINQKCAACGNKDTVDMTHKLTTFILAQEKKKKSDSKSDAKKAAKVEEEAPKKKKKEKNGATDEIEEPKKNSKKKSSKQELTGSEEVGGVEDVSAADEEENESKVVGECIERFRNWRIANPDATIAMVIEELRSAQTMSCLQSRDRVVIFLGAVFTESFVAENEVESNKEVLGELGGSEVLQRHLIAGFEWICGSRFPSKIGLFPVALKQLFDADLVDEDVFFEWHTSNVRNEHTVDASMISYEILEQLKEKAAPFITWLQEAEEDEEEEEEEDP